MSKLSTDIRTLSMNAMGWAERAEALEKQVKEFKRYATHKAGCQAPFMPYKKPNPCTCGLDDLLND